MLPHQQSLHPFSPSPPFRRLFCWLRLCCRHPQHHWLHCQPVHVHLASGESHLVPSSGPGPAVRGLNMYTHTHTHTTHKTHTHTHTREGFAAAVKTTGNPRQTMGPPDTPPNMAAPVLVVKRGGGRRALRRTAFASGSTGSIAFCPGPPATRTLVLTLQLGG